MYNKALRRIAGLSHALSFLTDLYGFEKLLQAVAVDNIPIKGMRIDLDAIRKIGLNIVQGLLSFLGQKELYEKQQMAAAMVSENFFAWPETALDAARDIYIEAETITESRTINVATIKDSYESP